jgi:hypothetical protein
LNSSKTLFIVLNYSFENVTFMYFQKTEIEAVHIFLVSN